MARVKSNLSTQIPSMQNWGGIRSIQKRLERSATIMENKEAAAKGEQAQFIATFANFLANNGVQTTQQQLSKIFQGLFGKG